jgi:hypothetical protein
MPDQAGGSPPLNRGRVSMLLRRLFLLPLYQLFVTTAFTLPERKHRVRITLALINRALRRNDLPATSWACSPPSSPLFHVDIQQLALVVHGEQTSPGGRPYSLSLTCDGE